MGGWVEVVGGVCPRFASFWSRRRSITADDTTAAGFRNTAKCDGDFAVYFCFRGRPRPRRRNPILRQSF